MSLPSPSAAGLVPDLVQFTLHCPADGSLPRLLALTGDLRAWTGEPADALLADPLRLLSCVDAEDLGWLGAELRRRREAGGATRGTLRLRAADGATRQLLVRAAWAAVPGGMQAEGVLVDVTALAQHDAERRAREERLRLALVTGRRGTWDWDVVTGRVVWDRIHFELFGYEPYAFEPTIAHFAHRVHPEDAAAVEAAITAAREARTDYRNEHRLLLPDGTVRWVRGTGAFLYDEAGQAIRMTGIAEDITEEKRIAAQIREGERFLDALFEGSPIGIQVFTPDGISIRYNAAHQRFLGLPGRDFGLGHYNLLTQCPPGCTAIVAAFERARGGEVAVVPNQRVDFGEFDREYPLARRVRWTDNTLFPIYDHAGAVQAVVVFVQDVTARREAELERERLEGGMRESQRLEALGVLAGGIAHDFNNLLAAVLGNAEVAQALLPDDAPAAAPLDRIGLAARRAAELCQQLLAYAGKGRTETGPVELSALVRETLVLLRHAVTPAARLELDLAAGLPPLDGDANQLRQVLMNLAINGAEALGETGGYLRIATCLRALRAADFDGWTLGGACESGRYLELEVEDSGHGMTEATRARIFEPFFTTKFTGRGLGLSAVLGIVRSHRGALLVTSTPGTGTTFRLRFPVAATAVPDLAPAAPPTAAAPVRATPGDTLLIADDDVAVRLATAQLAATLGYRTVEAADGAAALAAARARDGRFVAVLLDLTMPGLRTPEVLDGFHAAWPALPVLVMSGYAETEVLDALGDRLAGFLQKPFSRAELAARLAEARARVAG